MAASSVVTCNAAANLPRFSRKSNSSAPSQSSNAGVPLTQQFHWTRPQTAAFALSSNTALFETRRPSTRAFVRPDLVDAADDALAAFVQTTSQFNGASSGKPQFRSALEQVSYETNNTLMETSQTRPKPAQTRSLLARILNK